MSGGSPVRGKFMRQRHNQGYASSSEDIDLDDDACSRSSTSSTPGSPVPKARSWLEVVENVLWIASSVFILYYGDRHSNLIHLLWHDSRIKRTPLYLGMVGVCLVIAMALYTRVSELVVRKFDEKWEMSSISTLPLIMLLGFISFALFSFALWPIWSFLTLPLLFTLFMACLVMSPYVMIGTSGSQTDVLRID